MDKELRSLRDLIKEVFSDKSGTYKSIDELLTQNGNDQSTVPKKCADFITKQLCDNPFNDIILESENNEDDFHKVALNRAKHSVITYFMGLVLKPFGGIFDKIKNGDDLWLKTSMYHDYGYTSDYVKKEKLDLPNGIKAKYYLLDDYYADDLKCISGYKEKHPEDFAYDYSDLIKYFKYFQERKKNKPRNLEKNDDDWEGKIENQEHGILGGSYVFDKLTKLLIKNNIHNQKEFENIKKFCLAIAQHNIYKIKDEKDIIIAKKVSPNLPDNINNVKINESTPLLLFLSLVDTVECVKKFSRSENKEKYFETYTVLDNLYLSVEKDKITLDFSKLLQKAQLQHSAHDKSEKIMWFKKTFCGPRGYANAISTFNEWTILHGEYNNCIVTIRKDDSEIAV